MDADIQIVEVTSPDDFQLHYRAKEVADLLDKHYPNFLWQVSWAPGEVLVVKNALIGGGKYGYTIDNAMICTHRDLVRAAIQAGGELLERARMPRRAWNGEDMPKGLDGADKRHLPPL